MKIKLDKGQLILAGVSDHQYSVIRSWGCMEWNKTMKWLEGDCTLDALERLSELVRLPENAEKERQRLKLIQIAINAERNCEDPVPLKNYPVRASLYKHQIRGCNMALIAFGLIDPMEAINGISRDHERLQQDGRALQDA